MRYLQQLITPSLALLIAFTPFMVDVAKADTTSNVMVSQVDLSSANSNSASPTGGGIQAGHFELYQTPAGSKFLLAAVTDGSQTVNVNFDGTSMKLGDGYVLKTEITSDTPTEAVTKLDVTTADHRHATGVLRVDKQTQQVTSSNMAAVQALTMESGNMGVLNSALPVLMAIAQGQGGTNLGSTGNGILSCLFAWIAYAFEITALIAACGIPEPVEPIACGVAIATFVYAGEEFASNCAGH